MKCKFLFIGAVAVNFLLLATISNVALAQSANRMNTLKNCYTTDNRKVPCDKLDAENKKVNTAKDKKSK